LANSQFGYGKISNRYLILQNNALRAFLTANKFKKILKSFISEEGSFLGCVQTSPISFASHYLAVFTNKKQLHYLAGVTKFFCL